MSNVLSNWFSFGGVAAGPQPSELPEIFKLPIEQKHFVATEVQFIYSKILADVLERTSGLNEKVERVLWDSCLQTDTSDGLVTHLARAMSQKADLFLVYKADLGTLRVADQSEREKIKEEMKSPNGAKTGIGLSFKNHNRTDMVEFYTSLEFLTVASLYKSANLSKAIQIKVDSLRSSVAFSDVNSPAAQARGIAEALAAGKDVMTDGKDSITTTTPDISSVEKSIDFIDGKRSFFLGMPLSYINGLMKGGIGDSGNADARAVERGLKAYFFAVVKPVLKALFEVNASFKSEEYGLVETAMEVLKTFELVGNQFISDENKLLVVNKLLGIESKLGKPEAAPVVQPVRNEGGGF